MPIKNSNFVDYKLMDKIYLERENYESPFLQQIKNMKFLNTHKIYQRIDKRIYFKKPYITSLQKTLTFSELFKKLHIFNLKQYSRFLNDMEYKSKQHGEECTIIIFWDGFESDFKLPESEPKIINYQIFNNDGKLKFIGGAEFTYKKILYFTL